MAVSGVQFSGTTAAAGTSDQRMSQTVSSEDFLKLLITELTHQDPLDPMDNQQLLNQLSAIRTMEYNMQLTETLKQMLTQSQMGSAASLIGKMIEGKDVFGVDVKGIVESLQIVDGQVSLTVDGAKVPFEGVFRVLDAPDETGTSVLGPAIAGDLNNDGVLDAMDLAEMKTAYADPVAWQLANSQNLHAFGDMNTDGIFNSLDIQVLQQKLQEGED